MRRGESRVRGKRGEERRGRVRRGECGVRGERGGTPAFVTATGTESFRHVIGRRARVSGRRLHLILRVVA